MTVDNGLTQPPKVSELPRAVTPKQRLKLARCDKFPARMEQARKILREGQPVDAVIRYLTADGCSEAYTATVLNRTAVDIAMEGLARAIPSAQITKELCRVFLRSTRWATAIVRRSRGVIARESEIPKEQLRAQSGEMLRAIVAGKAPAATKVRAIEVFNRLYGLNLEQPGQQAVQVNVGQNLSEELVRLAKSGERTPVVDASYIDSVFDSAPPPREE